MESDAHDPRRSRHDSSAASSGATVSKPTTEKRRFTESSLLDEPPVVNKKKSFVMIGKAPGMKKKNDETARAKASLVPIKMDLGSQKQEASVLKKRNATVASVFNEDSESEDEEMPFEARMRMKNVGKYTPTAAGPNSFGKSRIGFVDRRALLKKELEKEWQKTKAEDEEFKCQHKVQINFS